MNKPNATDDMVSPGLGLSVTDGQLLHQALLTGDQALARRKDLGELHRRTVEMITTLHNGLDEQQKKHAEDERHALSERLDRLETAINATEAVLRIELGALIAKSVEQAFSHAATQTTGRGWSNLATWILTVTALTSCVLAGALYAQEIGTSVRALQTAIFGQIAIFQLDQPPNGGIEAAANRLK
jgi:hypothetical protein